MNDDMNNAACEGCPDCGWSNAACRCAEQIAADEATDALVDELASRSEIDACECCLASPCIFIQARNRSAA
jgi:hypothetical protein